MVTPRAVITDGEQCGIIASSETSSLVLTARGFVVVAKDEISELQQCKIWLSRGKMVNVKFNIYASLVSEARGEELEAQLEQFSLDNQARRELGNN